MYSRIATNKKRFLHQIFKIKSYICTNLMKQSNNMKYKIQMAVCLTYRDKDVEVDVFELLLCHQSS